jgi:hypothetical protein
MVIKSPHRYPRRRADVADGGVLPALLPRQPRRRDEYIRRRFQRAVVVGLHAPPPQAIVRFIIPHMPVLYIAAILTRKSRCVTVKTEHRSVFHKKT